MSGALTDTSILAGAAGAGGYTIDQSLRFNPGDSPALKRTPGSVGNRQIYTISTWAKVCNQEIGILEAWTDTNNLTAFYVDDASFRIYARDSSDDIYWNSSGGGRLFRDPAAWYHFCIAVDTTDGTATDRIKVWVNNELITGWGTQTGPSSSYSTDINNTIEHWIGSFRQNSATRVYPDQYLAEYYLIDGQALTPASFAETNEDTNQWTAIKYAGTYGTNGFLLKFEDSADLGNDSSGNGNDYTNTNLAATDQMVDSPTNNFATLNSLLKPQNAVAYSEGNLQSLSTGAWNGVVGTAGVSSGKWYWEQVVITQFYSEHGIVGNNASLWLDGGANPQTGTGMILYGYNGKKNIDNTETSYGDTFTSDDIIGVALNMDDSEVTFYKNNVAQDSGTPISFAGEIVNASLVMPCSNQTGGGANPANEYHFNAGQDSSFAGNFTAQGNTDSNGVGDFYYEPPADYLALCTSNLPDPEIKLPGAHFNTVLYTADASSGNAVTGVGFQPDLVWAKDRDYTENHGLADAVRGSTCLIASNLTNAEACHSTYIESFDSDGFTVGSDGWLNRGTDSYVAWNWLAGTAPTADNSAGAGATPTAGSVKINGSNLGSALAGTTAATRLSADTTNGFSIVKYVGTGGAATIAHGLSVAPELFIIKKLESGAWPVGSTYMGMNKYMQLNTDAAEATDTGPWNNTSPTASVWSVGADSGTNENTANFIAYLFHSVEGYSKVGTYEGNGNADGPFVYLGFRPAWIMIKRVDADSPTGWTILDDKRVGYNVANAELFANLNNAEEANNRNDLVSNGYKGRATSSNVNNSSGTYLYLAFAQSPFKTANAR